MTALDRRFGPALRMMQESAHKGEREAARVRLEEFARRAGLTLKQAIAHHGRPTPEPQPVNIFAGFDDWMEEKEPGWKAKKAAEKAERAAAWRRLKADLIAEAGSVEAVVAPCEREMILLAAVKQWRKTSPRPHQRWTKTLDGWNDWDFSKAPPHVLAAVRAATPMPSSFYAAKAELDYWNRRDKEIEAVLNGEMPIGDTMLDLVADMRRWVIQKHVETDLEVSNLGEAMARFAMAEAAETTDTAMYTAVYRDMRRLLTGSLA